MKRPLSDKDEALRDEFAGMALQAILTWPTYIASDANTAQRAYQIANAMMEEKFKQPNEVKCPR